LTQTLFIETAKAEEAMKQEGVRRLNVSRVVVVISMHPLNHQKTKEYSLSRYSPLSGAKYIFTENSQTTTVAVHGMNSHFKLHFFVIVQCVNIVKFNMLAAQDALRANRCFPQRLGFGSL